MSKAPEKTTGRTTPAPQRSAAADRVAKPQARTLERRKAVLEAALAVFGAHGYNKGALAEIADQAGMTHAGVLHHFGTKEGLLVAVLRHRDGEAVAGVAGRAQIEGPAFLGHLVDTAEENLKHRGVVQTYAVLSAESVTEGHPAQEYFRGRLAGLRLKVEGVMRDVVGPDADPKAVRDGANAVIAVMDGLQVQWLLDPNAVDMPATVQTVLDEIIDRLSTGTPAPSARRRADRMRRPVPADGKE
ncbi:TetR/AcrR family transcriptional regulator [Leifsonia poae]|uniref:TetR/AcrR family transcriptional regulator n=1 Tax=Leifsonia poae TaxID=110933 RepID=UPI001CBD8F7F|nr:TetR/AcrR family transcriptional regulator [Leifsonia poae]